MGQKLCLKAQGSPVGGKKSTLGSSWWRRGHFATICSDGRLLTLRPRLGCIYPPSNPPLTTPHPYLPRFAPRSKSCLQCFLSIRLTVSRSASVNFAHLPISKQISGTILKTHKNRTDEAFWTSAAHTNSNCLQIVSSPNCLEKLHDSFFIATGVSILT